MGTTIASERVGHSQRPKTVLDYRAARPKTVRFVALCPIFVCIPDLAHPLHQGKSKGGTQTLLWDLDAIGVAMES